MEPLLTTVVTAFAIGAAKAASEVGSDVIKDAYSALKHLALASYGKVQAFVSMLGSVEARPSNEHLRDAFAVELENLGASKNQELIRLARAVLDAARPADFRAIGLQVDDIEAEKLRIGLISAGSTGLVAKTLKAKEINIENIGSERLGK